jgi:hypothetical protein
MCVTTGVRRSGMTTTCIPLASLNSLTCIPRGCARVASGKTTAAEPAAAKIAIALMMLFFTFWTSPNDMSS